MKIYTKTGDDGTTGMIGGTRASKADPRIDCYGTVDELNASLGLAACMVSGSVLEQIRRVQNDLFVLGSHLALPHHVAETSIVASGLPPLRQQSIDQLESEIDVVDALLPALTQFILPGGSELAARFHVARSICRRTERLVVALHSQTIKTRFVITYLNRLSDWLFVAARLANHVAGVPDIPWQK